MDNEKESTDNAVAISTESSENIESPTKGSPKKTVQLGIVQSSQGGSRVSSISVSKKSRWDQGPEQEEMEQTTTEEKLQDDSSSLDVKSLIKKFEDIAETPNTSVEESTPVESTSSSSNTTQKPSRVKLVRTNFSSPTKTSPVPKVVKEIDQVVLSEPSNTENDAKKPELTENASDNDKPTEVCQVTSSKALQIISSCYDSPSDESSQDAETVSKEALQGVSTHSDSTSEENNSDKSKTGELNVTTEIVQDAAVSNLEEKKDIKEKQVLESVKLSTKEDLSNIKVDSESLSDSKTIEKHDQIEELEVTKPCSLPDINSTPNIVSSSDCVKTVPTNANQPITNKGKEQADIESTSETEEDNQLSVKKEYSEVELAQTKQTSVENIEDWVMITEKDIEGYSENKINTLDDIQSNVDNHGLIEAGSSQKSDEKTPELVLPEREKEIVREEEPKSVQEEPCVKEVMYTTGVVGESTLEKIPSSSQNQEDDRPQNVITKETDSDSLSHTEVLSNEKIKSETENVQELNVCEPAKTSILDKTEKYNDEIDATMEEMFSEEPSCEVASDKIVDNTDLEKPFCETSDNPPVDNLSEVTTEQTENEKSNASKILIDILDVDKSEMSSNDDSKNPIDHNTTFEEQISNSPQTELDEENLAPITAKKNVEVAETSEHTTINIDSEMKPTDSSVVDSTNVCAQDIKGCDSETKLSDGKENNFSDGLGVTVTSKIDNVTADHVTEDNLIENKIIKETECSSSLPSQETCTHEELTVNNENISEEGSTSKADVIIKSKEEEVIPTAKVAVEDFKVLDEETGHEDVKVCTDEEVQVRKDEEVKVHTDEDEEVKVCTDEHEAVKVQTDGVQVRRGGDEVKVCKDEDEELKVLTDEDEAVKVHSDEAEKVRSDEEVKVRTDEDEEVKVCTDKDEKVQIRTDEDFVSSIELNATEIEIKESEAKLEESIDENVESNICAQTTETKELEVPALDSEEKITSDKMEIVNDNLTSQVFKEKAEVSIKNILSIEETVEKDIEEKPCTNQLSEPNLLDEETKHEFEKREESRLEPKLPLSSESLDAEEIKSSSTACSLEDSAVETVAAIDSFLEESDAINIEKELESSKTNKNQEDILEKPLTDDVKGGSEDTLDTDTNKESNIILKSSVEDTSLPEMVINVSECKTDAEKNKNVIDTPGNLEEVLVSVQSGGIDDSEKEQELTTTKIVDAENVIEGKKETLSLTPSDEISEPQDQKESVVEIKDVSDTNEQEAEFKTKENIESQEIKSSADGLVPEAIHDGNSITKAPGIADKPPQSDDFISKESSSEKPAVKRSFSVVEQLHEESTKKPRVENNPDENLKPNNETAQKSLESEVIAISTSTPTTVVFSGELPTTEDVQPDLNKASSTIAGEVKEITTEENLPKHSTSLPHQEPDVSSTESDVKLIETSNNSKLISKDVTTQVLKKSDTTKVLPRQSLEANPSEEAISSEYKVSSSEPVNVKSKEIAISVSKSDTTISDVKKVSPIKLKLSTTKIIAKGDNSQETKQKTEISSESLPSNTTLVDRSVIDSSVIEQTKTSDKKSSTDESLIEKVTDTSKFQKAEPSSQEKKTEEKSEETCGKKIEELQLQPQSTKDIETNPVKESVSEKQLEVIQKDASQESNVTLIISKPIKSEIAQSSNEPKLEHGSQESAVKPKPAKEVVSVTPVRVSARQKQRQAAAAAALEKAELESKTVPENITKKGLLEKGGEKRAKKSMSPMKEIHIKIPGGKSVESRSSPVSTKSPKTAAPISPAIQPITLKLSKEENPVIVRSSSLSPKKVLSPQSPQTKTLGYTLKIGKDSTTIIPKDSSLSPKVRDSSPASSASKLESAGKVEYLIRDTGLTITPVSPAESQEQKLNKITLKLSKAGGHPEIKQEKNETWKAIQKLGEIDITPVEGKGTLDTLKRKEKFDQASNEKKLRLDSVTVEPSTSAGPSKLQGLLTQAPLNVQPETSKEGSFSIIGQQAEKQQASEGYEIGLLKPDPTVPIPRKRGRPRKISSPDSSQSISHSLTAKDILAASLQHQTLQQQLQIQQLQQQQQQAISMIPSEEDVPMFQCPLFDLSDPMDSFMEPNPTIFPEQVQPAQEPILRSARGRPIGRSRRPRGSGLMRGIERGGPRGRPRGSRGIKRMLEEMESLSYPDMEQPITLDNIDAEVPRIMEPVMATESTMALLRKSIEFKKENKARKSEESESLNSDLEAKVREMKEKIEAAYKAELKSPGKSPDKELKKRKTEEKTPEKVEGKKGTPELVQIHKKLEKSKESPKKLSDSDTPKIKSPERKNTDPFHNIGKETPKRKISQDTADKEKDKRRSTDEKVESKEAKRRSTDEKAGSKRKSIEDKDESKESQEEKQSINEGDDMETSEQTSSQDSTEVEEVKTEPEPPPKPVKPRPKTKAEIKRIKREKDRLRREAKKLAALEALKAPPPNPNEEDTRMSASDPNGDGTELVKKSRGMEVGDPEGKEFTVEDIAEYQWPLQGGELYMIQEQISTYLGVKSFKRKYPDLRRRPVEMEEKSYLYESGLVSESMCDLGLTAVSSSEVLDVLFQDFPDKYEELRRVMREKAAQELINKQKERKKFEQSLSKSDLKEHAIQSAMSWNQSLNRARTDTRQCHLDLQTWTIQYPRSKGAKMTRPTPKLGNYPVAVIPGQYADYYKRYTPQELRYWPINTVLYGPLQPNERHSTGGSEGSQSESEDSSSSDDSSDSSSDGEGSEEEKEKEKDAGECRACNGTGIKKESKVKCTQCGHNSSTATAWA